MSAVYHKLSDGNLTQDWSNSALLKSANNWSNVPSIEGFATIDGAHGRGTDPRTLTGDSDDLDVATNVSKSPSRFQPNGEHGGVAEFQDFGIVALGGGPNAGAPNLVFYLDTTGIAAPVNVNFDVQDLDGSSRDAQEQLNVQYRVGETGPWINVPGGYIADVTSPNATSTTHVSVSLPLDALGQPQLQVRVMTTNAAGRDEWVGIDNIVIACFVTGTLISTPRGEIPVETLSIGDEVCVINGSVKPIKWIGRRSFAATFIANSSSAKPITICANAIDDGVPYRDLRVSPQHALFIAGVLVPAAELVNGSTIVQDMTDMSDVEYFHIEVEGQAVVLANGAAAETYVNHNNRKMFANWQEYQRLYDDDEPTQQCGDEFARIYPCVRGGPVFDKIVLNLSQRAQLREIAC